VKYNLVSIFVFISSLSLGKEIVHSETYDNGNIKSIEYHQLLNNKIVFLKVINFYENGFKKEEKSLKDDGTIDGFYIDWYDNGQKKVKEL
tara:strand:+ start:200 stop:469 length:270 start_codon:yes stop_codon:yes gene_type:complete